MVADPNGPNAESLQSPMPGALETLRWLLESGGTSPQRVLAPKAECRTPKTTASPPAPPYILQQPNVLTLFEA